MRSLSRRIPIRGRGYSLASKAFGPLACNTYALVCDCTQDAAIVDPSFCTSSEFQELVDHLEVQNVSNVKHILLTHGHPDHVAGVSQLLKAWPKASLHLHSLEHENYFSARQVGLDFGITLPDEPLPTPTDDLRDADIIRIGESIQLSVVHTPGHSPGHVAFVDTRHCESKSADKDSSNEENKASASKRGSVLLSGDLLFQGSVGRTDFPNSSIDDLYASIRRLYELFDDESIVLSGHTTPTFLKKEKLTNPFVDLALRRPLEWYMDAKDRHGWNDIAST